MDYGPERLLPYLEFHPAKGEEWHRAQVRCACGETSFSVAYSGRVLKSILGRISLFQQDDSAAAVYARCSRCGQEMMLFHSIADSSPPPPDGETGNERLQSQLCPKCGNSLWRTQMEFEYPSDDDDPLPRLQWERISLKCACCGYLAKNYLDLEIE